MCVYIYIYISPLNNPPTTILLLYSQKYNYSEVGICQSLFIA